MRYSIETHDAESCNRYYTLKVYGTDGSVVLEKENKDYTYLKITAEKNFPDAKQDGNVTKR